MVGLFDCPVEQRLANWWRAGHETGEFGIRTICVHQLSGTNLVRMHYSTQQTHEYRSWIKATHQCGSLTVQRRGGTRKAFTLADLDACIVGSRVQISVTQASYLYSKCTLVFMPAHLDVSVPLKKSPSPSENSLLNLKFSNKITIDLLRNVCVLFTEIRLGHTQLFASQ